MSVALRLGGRPRAAPQCEIVVDDVLYVYTRKNNVSGWRNQWMVQFRPSCGGKWMACYIKNGQTDDEDTIAQEIRKKLEKVAHTSAPAPAPAASVPSPLHTRAPNERTAAELHNISPSKVGTRHQCNRPTHEERVRTTRRVRGRRTRRRRPRRRRVRETHCPRAQGGAGGPRGPALGTESRPPRPPPRDRRRRSRHRRRPRSLVDAHAPRSRGCSTSSHPTPLAPTRSPGRPGTLKRLPGPIFPRGRRSGDARPPFLLQAHGA